MKGFISYVKNYISYTGVLSYNGFILRLQKILMCLLFSNYSAVTKDCSNNPSIFQQFFEKNGLVDQLIDETLT